MGCSMKKFFEDILIFTARVVLAVSILAVLYCICCSILKFIGVLLLRWKVILIPGLVGLLIIIAAFIGFIIELSNNS